MIWFIGFLVIAILLEFFFTGFWKGFFIGFLSVTLIQMILGK